ncbi:MAG: cyclic peptide export ABC transporter [Methylococcaceae bacterium]|jgi:putative ATP-binding cassette transporter
MNIIKDFLLNSWQLAAVAWITSIVSGISRVGLLIITNLALESGQDTRAFSLMFVGLCLVLLISAIISETILVGMGQSCIFQLRIELSQRILATPLRQLQHIGRDRLMTAFTEDITSIANAFSLMPIMCIDGSLILGCLVYIGWLSWSLLLTVVVFIVIGIISFRFLQHRALRWLHAARDRDDELYAHFRSLIDGNKELKMHKRRRQAFFEIKLHAAADSIRHKMIKGMAFYTLADHWGNLLFYIAIWAVLFVLSEPAMTTQIKIGYVLSILYLMGPLASLMSALPGLGRGIVALRNISAMKQSLTKAESDNGSDSCFACDSNPSVLELRGIQHAYHHNQDDQGFVLGPLDLTFQPGELVFFIGGNGSGKTTLALILLGLYAPDHGGVYLNGELITDMNRDAYRQQFAAVFSDAFLFESLFGHEHGDVGERVQELLGKLQLKHKVKLQDNRFSTLELSQGQRKRLALLSAYIDNRAFYVFDEWAAEQDPVFKNLFYTELLPELKALGKTVLVITHDDQYYNLADRYIRFESGRIVN